jgi:glycerate 2-kinase
MMDGMDTAARALLASLFRSAVAAAHPAAVLPSTLPEPPPRGRLVIPAAGKAAGAMTEVAEQYYLRRLPRQRLAGLAVTRHCYGRPTQLVPVINAGHLVPDAAGISATKRVLALADASILTIWSWFSLPAAHRRTGSPPVDAVTLAEKQAVTRATQEQRRHRRDERAAQASIAHQGRPPHKTRLSR